MINKKIYLFGLFSLCMLLPVACNKSESQTNSGNEEYVDQYEDWNGPGWYYGIYYYNRGDYYNWRRGRRYRRHHRREYRRYHRGGRMYRDGRGGRGGRRR